MPTHRAAVSAVLLLLSPLGPRVWALDPSLLKGAAATLHWEGQQFIQADAQGNVFLLRGDPLEVYPLTKSHDLGEPVRLATTVRSGFPVDAAMSADGSWAVIMESKVHYFVDGQEVTLPDLAPGLKPVAVGFLRGDPVTTVTPMPRGVAHDNSGIPLLLRAANDSWSAELRELRHAPDDPGMERAYRAALVLDDRDGRYFLAREYSYRIELRRLGRDRPLEELHLADTRPVLKPYSEAEKARLLAEVTAAGKSVPGGGTVSLSPGRSALLALARRGAGGPLYALLGAGIAGEHCALDRIDWGEQRVERVTLNFPCKGRVSMAAGKDGLFLAEWNGREGRYFVSWGALDEAQWATVKEATFSP